MSKAAKRNTVLAGVAALTLVILSAFTVLRGTNQSATFNFPLAVGNSWVYAGTATYRQGDTEMTKTATGSIEILRQRGADTFEARLKGQLPEQLPQFTTALLVQDELGVIFGSSADGRRSGLLLSQTLEVGRIFTFRAGRRGDTVVFLLVQSVNETVQVPAGTFTNAIQLNFALNGELDSTAASASGKIFLVSDVGIVKIEGVFNGGDVVGQARLELAE